MKVNEMSSLAFMAAEDKRKAFEENFDAQLEVGDNVKVACQSATSRSK